MRFPGRHAQVQEEVIVAVDELDHLRQDFVILIGARQRRANRAQEQRGGGPVAVMALIAHVQRLGDQALDVNAIRAGFAGRGRARGKDRSPSISGGRYTSGPIPP